MASLEQRNRTILQGGDDLLRLLVFWSIFLPLLVGGIPTAIVVWTAFYFPLRGLIAKYQHARQARRERKLRLQALHAREHEAAAAAQESGVVLQTERRSGRGESL